MMEAAQALPGVELVVTGADAAARFGLPPDLEGDFVALGDRNTVIGARAAEHDLSGLAGHRLRSHGGIGEQRVPFMVSEPLTARLSRREAPGCATSISSMPSSMVSDGTA